MTEESKTDSIYNIDVIEGKRANIDKRPEIMKDLGIDARHPIYLERLSELDMFPHDIQCMFLKVIADEIQESDEAERMRTRRERLGNKLTIMKEKRLKSKH